MKNTKKVSFALMIGALGVVFGDIGTSPLYALSAIFGAPGHHLALNQSNVHGIISLIIWSITIVVSIKYIAFIMRADNQGEGGIIALTALIKSSNINPKRASIFVFLGLIGVALFYGDSTITPAISVMSAVEGLGLVEPKLVNYVLPITIVILIGLFWIQQYGTRVIGKLFGPVMLVWFTVLALGGAWQIWLSPSILASLSPAAAVSFFISQPALAFISMAAVILTITGAEALYADMGHFGRAPIARSWFLFVFPALVICYMGQGAMLLANPEAVTTPLFYMYPDSMRFTIVIIATLATLIASQSVISGAFSLTRQAVHLGFLPRMIIKHTSKKEIGQVYLPFVNMALLIVVCLLVLIFGTSQKLAGAYGMAVSITLAIDTILFIVVARVIWKKSIVYSIMMIVGFLLIDLLFVASNFTKIIHGGWFPLVLASFVLIIITTWVHGQKIVSKKRQAQEGPLQDFVNTINDAKPAIRRVPGEAIYIGHHENYAPLALRATVEKLNELHEKVIVVSAEITNESHIAEDKRSTFNALGYADGISYVHIKYGYHDSPNIPRSLEYIRATNKELEFNPETVEYFVSQSKIVQTKRHNLAGWRKRLYCLMVRNALSTSDYYKLPTNRTIEIRSLIEL